VRSVYGETTRQQTIALRPHRPMLWVSFSLLWFWINDKIRTIALRPQRPLLWVSGYVNMPAEPNLHKDRHEHTHSNVHALSNAQRAVRYSRGWAPWSYPIPIPGLYVSRSLPDDMEVFCSFRKRLCCGRVCNSVRARM
jgi:hypothetical protein